MKDFSVEERIKVIPILSAVLSAGVSGVLLFIWLFVPSMKAFSSATMKANSALAMFLASISLWLLKDLKKGSRPYPRILGYILAGLVAVIGFSTTAEY
jgi:hypothetical protein